MSTEVDQQSQEDDTPFNGVVIVREFNEDGGVGTKVILSGNVKPTEVQTIIDLGLKGWREQIGV